MKDVMDTLSRGLLPCERWQDLLPLVRANPDLARWLANRVRMWEEGERLPMWHDGTQPAWAQNDWFMSAMWLVVCQVFGCYRCGRDGQVPVSEGNWLVLCPVCHGRGWLLPPK